MVADEKPILKSVKSHTVAYVRFINQCKRKAAVYWIDFEGKRIRYSLLNHAQHMIVNTYVGHPWTFADAGTNDQLVTSKGDEYYFPVAWNGMTDADYVYIRLPIYTLRDRCMQVVKEYYNESDIQSLVIPNEIKHDLLNGRNESDHLVRVAIRT